MNINLLINIFYIFSAILFVFGLKMLSSPETAPRGNLLSAMGMLLAVLATLITKGLSFQWILPAMLIGSVIGFLAAKRVAMTSMPEMVALFNGSGGLASFLVGWSVYHYQPHSSLLASITIFLTLLIGGVTFTGSVVAWGKLSGKIQSRPIMYKGQQAVNLFILTLLLLSGIVFCMRIGTFNMPFVFIIFASLLLGVLVVIPIGGADMPVVISLLNSYSGLAASAAGFVIQNNILIVAGALVGASGLILTNIMCKAMNRSLLNVLFSGFGGIVDRNPADSKGEAKSISAKDAFYILEAARSFVMVPGYGLAVAQAQHALRELGELLEKNGAEVKYAIHPVAGRMPGHMNVLLAEANVSYDQMFEMDAINPLMPLTDVCIVIGANDVINPAAQNDQNSSIYGMPIIEAHKARTVIVLKRSMATGFAGIQNELFYYENTRMLFGDAKGSLQYLVSEFKNM